MTNMLIQTRLLAITKDPWVQETIETALKDEQDFVILDNSVLSKGIFQAVQIRQPDIIIFDYKFDGANTYNTIDKIVSEFPSSVVITLLPEEEAQNSNKVILAGARAFLQVPFTTEAFIQTLHRVVELLARVPSATPKTKQPSRPKNTFVVFSPKGGVGCTTVAINLAIALQKTLGEDVLLVDGKHMFGHVALMLNLRTANSISDLIAHSGVLDSTLIRQVVGKHASGISVLPSPISIYEAQGIRPDDLYKVILGLQNVYQNIIIDGGSFLNDNTVTYMDSADRVILLLIPNLASLRDTRQFLDLSHNTLSYSASKIMLVLNQVGHKTDVNNDEIERVLQAKLSSTIPSDENLVLSSLNDGVPILIKKPRHDISKAINKLANQIAEIIRANNNPEENAGISAEILAKSSRLG